MASSQSFRLASEKACNVMIPCLLKTNMLYIQFIPVMSLHIYNFKNSYLTIKVKFEKNQKNQKRGKRERKRQQKNEKKN